MQIEPLSDVVVIRRQTQQEVSSGGIYLPLSDELREDIGTIVFAGKGRLSNKGIRIPMEVKEGMKVLFSTNGHQITTVNGEELIVLREPSIIGVIEGEDVHSYGSEQEGS